MLGRKEILKTLAANGSWMHGLEIVKAANSWKVMRGVVYVTLNTLIDDGLVEEQIGPPHAFLGEPRQFYRITAKGRANLK